MARLRGIWFLQLHLGTYTENFKIDWLLNVDMVYFLDVVLLDIQDRGLRWKIFLKKYFYIDLPVCTLYI